MVYDLSVSRARDPLIAITVFAAFGVLTTALRLKTRQMRKVALGVDDFLMLAALVRAPPLCGLLVMLTMYAAVLPVCFDRDTICLYAYSTSIVILVAHFIRCSGWWCWPSY